MNSDNHFKRKERPLPPYLHLRWLAIALAIAGLATLLYYINVQLVGLDIVSPWAAITRARN